MQSRCIDLADFLAASGTAMGCANLRLRAENAPALLQEFTLGIDFQAAFCLPEGAGGVRFGNISRPSAQQTVLFRGTPSNIKIKATYVAAPSLVPVAPFGGVAGG